MKELLLGTLRERKLQFLIIKDIPIASPLLKETENEFARHLISWLQEDHFFSLSGQALAYVPINFRSIDEYLQRFSRSRRKNLKRKLRSASKTTIEHLESGDEFFTDAITEMLYGLYLNVFEKSDIHFDRLSPAFFRKLFKDNEVGGQVFLYRSEARIIGFNLCFVVGNRLVDKYIGFLYPYSREHNLYFVSWFHNLEFCIHNDLEFFVAGWTDPEIKAYLGAEFTLTTHVVYIRNPLLRYILSRFKSLFESDSHVISKLGWDSY
jgi:predicted N-acyltransferase